MKKYNNKIIIIDSGIGGLSIIEKIFFLKINYIYIMDNYGFPYGNKNYIYIYKRIYKIINYLNNIYIIDFIIIACNTASIICLKYIKKKFNFPILGIFPNIKKSFKITKNKNILLLGTYITINSNYINKIINKKNKKFNIIKYYSSELVNESEKKIKFKKINIKKIKNIFLNIFKNKKYSDTIINGCTHFVFLEKEFKIIFKKIFKKNIYIINHINNLKNKINKYIKINNYSNKKNYFFYTKKEKFNNYFIKKIKKKYFFYKIKKIKI